MRRRGTQDTCLWHLLLLAIVISRAGHCVALNEHRRVKLNENDENTFLRPSIHQKSAESVEISQAFPMLESVRVKFKKQKRPASKTWEEEGEIDELFVDFGVAGKSEKKQPKRRNSQKQLQRGSSVENVAHRHRTNENRHLQTMPMPTTFPDAVLLTTPKIKRISKPPSEKTGYTADSKSSPKKASQTKKNVTKSAKSVSQTRKRPILPSLYTRNREEHNILSGQEIRLSGGKTHNEGLVEVFHYGRWGLICDDNWQLADGNIVCKQLGYHRGAQSAMGGSYYGVSTYRHNDILMDEVECKGTEHRVQECPHNTVHDCTLSEAASVSCMLNDGCEHGWVAGDEVCYRLSDDIAMFDAAKEACEDMGAHLVTVENQQESDFITNWLMTASNETYFWSAGKLVTEEGMPTWKWLDIVYPMKFTKWFPGWPPNSIHRQPSNHTGQECVTLARRFYDPWNLVRDVGYYFWNDAPCNVRIPYICKKLASSHTDCYSGYGEGYSGRVHRTDKGTLCVKWVLSPKINPLTHPSRGLGDHNYCRNPDDDVKPWCWVDVEKGRFGYCAVDPCETPSTPPPVSARPVTTTPVSTPVMRNSTVTARPGAATPSTTTPTIREGELPHTDIAPIDVCSASEFECNQTDDRLCIPLLWQCDGELDCPSGEDEENCNSNHMEDYKMLSGKKMVLANRRDVHTLSYVYISAEKCAKHCSTARNFVCRSFNHIFDSDQKQECTLFNVTASFGGGRLVNATGATYYEATNQIANCSVAGLFSCANGRCINDSLLCDGHDNCNDFSDETSCSTAMPPVSVRLAGGEHAYEGRVEIRYFGEWGVICDDGWDLKDANVICRQLGYHGATRATKMSEFGAGAGNFLLDEVACTGREMSVTQCKHNGWRNHDCGNYEAAGVVCKEKRVCDENSQFECTNRNCIPITYICDGENDCGDSSDEQECRGFEVQLMGGGSEYEGRVEIVRNGMQGTVCDDDWDDNDAVVVCRMLGFLGPAQAITGGKFGQGGGAIWLDDVDCKGTEASLDLCSHAPWGSHNCLHGEDAGVMCTDLRTTPPPSKSLSTDSGLIPSTAPQPLPLQCGQRPIYQKEPRIAGGFIADYGAYPWQVAVWRWRLASGWGHWCGGAILNDRWILTAAHPYVNRPKEHIRVVIGNLHNQEIDEHEQQFNVEAIVSHKSYSRYTHDNDIALIKISPNTKGQFIRFSRHVQPVCLPTSEDRPLPTGQSCLISGWGSSSSGRVFSNHLRAAMVPIVNDTICRMIYKYDLTERMLCAGFLEGNVDSCQGDSGGSLVCNVDGQYTVLGVTSWGHGCAQPYAPGVYTKVQQFLPWIYATMARLS